MLQPADRGWIQIASHVLTWDITCPSGQTLSERFRDYARAHPLLVTATVAYLVAHLYGVLPPRLDPLHQLAEARHLLQPE